MEVSTVINKLFGAVIGVVIGIAMMPVVIDSVNNVRYTDGNISTPATLPTGVDSLLALVPLLYVVLIVAGVVYYLKGR